MTETINGFLLQRPGREPEKGQIRCFTVEHRPAANGKQAWIKVKNSTPDKGGQDYLIVTVGPTGRPPDAYGNVSFNIELEKIPQPAAERASGHPGASTGYPDERSHRIERQHSQEMAVRYAALKGLTAIEPDQFRLLIDWFQRDIANIAEKEGEQPW